MSVRSVGSYLIHSSSIHVTTAYAKMISGSISTNLWQMNFYIGIPYSKCHNPGGDCYWVEYMIQLQNEVNPQPQIHLFLKDLPPCFFCKGGKQKIVNSTQMVCFTSLFWVISTYQTTQKTLQRKHPENFGTGTSTCSANWTPGCQH